MNSSNSKSPGRSIAGSANKLRFDALNRLLRPNASSVKIKKNKRASLSKQVSRVALSELLNDASFISARSSQDIPDFKTFLSDNNNIQEFREFLKTQYCQENIDFYIACEKYRKLDHRSGRIGRDLIKFMAMQIFQEFLSKDARQPVNIDYSSLKGITEQIDEPHQDLFVNAQTEIFNLMDADCYPRFCKTWRLDKNIAKQILNSKQSHCNPVDGLQVTSLKAPPCDTSSILSDSQIIHSIARQNLAANEASSTSSISSDYSKRGKQDTSYISTNSYSTERSVMSMVSTSSHCPQKCPYYRVGLPCDYHHHKNKNNNQTNNGDTTKPTRRLDSSSLMEEIDLSKIHHVPACVTRRAPPPPPLPPRPTSIEPTKSQPGAPTASSRPYVGKVFNV